MFNNKKYECLILGGGITGAAILYVLSKYTNIKRIALLEKYPKIGTVNTNSESNSQTLHFGDIETNYSLEKVKVVKEAAEMMEKYLLQLKDSSGKFYIKSHKVALGVGEHEVEILDKRFDEFKTLFPKIKKLNREEIAEIEPEIVKGRDHKEKISAIYSPDGYAVDYGAVDYGAVANSFIERAIKDSGKEIDIFFNSKVKSIKKNGTYEIVTNKINLRGDVVISAMGAHSLLFAKSLDYGRDYMILPVAGNFYCSTKKILNGKVYTIQKEKLPFAAVHGDPNIHNPNETRFGPTAKVLPVLERRRLATFKDFVKSAGIDFRSAISLFKIVFDKDILGFIGRNLIYDLPFIGERYFLQSVRKIAPSATIKDLKYGKGFGGIRPQLVDKINHKMLLGEAEIIGDNIIFNITPSPGATAALKTAEVNAKRIVKFLGANYKFDEEGFNKDFR